MTIVTLVVDLSFSCPSPPRRTLTVTLTEWPTALSFSSWTDGRWQSDLMVSFVSNVDAPARLTKPWHFACFPLSNWWRNYSKLSRVILIKSTKIFVPSKMCGAKRHITFRFPRYLGKVVVFKEMQQVSSKTTHEYQVYKACLSPDKFSICPRGWSQK